MTTLKKLFLSLLVILLLVGGTNASFKPTYGVEDTCKKYEKNCKFWFDAALHGLINNTIQTQPKEKEVYYPYFDLGVSKARIEYNLSYEKFKKFENRRMKFAIRNIDLYLKREGIISYDDMTRKLKDKLLNEMFLEINDSKRTLHGDYGSGAELNIVGSFFDLYHDDLYNYNFAWYNLHKDIYKLQCMYDGKCLYSNFVSFKGNVKDIKEIQKKLLKEINNYTIEQMFKKTDVKYVKRFDIYSRTGTINLINEDTLIPIDINGNRIIK